MKLYTLEANVANIFSTESKNVVTVTYSCYRITTKSMTSKYQFIYLRCYFLLYTLVIYCFMNKFPQNFATENSNQHLWADLVLDHTFFILKSYSKKRKLMAALHQACLWCHFCKSICSLLASLSHFINFHNISHFFTLVYVTVICRSVIYDLLKLQMMVSIF